MIEVGDEVRYFSGWKHNFVHGTVNRIEGLNVFCNWDDGDEEGFMPLGRLELVRKGVNMKFAVGDIIEDSDGDFIKILGIINGYYVASQFADSATSERLEKPTLIVSEADDRTYGWSKYDDTVQEFTLEQIATKLNVPVSQLRIKD